MSAPDAVKRLAGHSGQIRAETEVGAISHLGKALMDKLATDDICHQLLGCQCGEYLEEILLLCGGLNE